MLLEMNFIVKFDNLLHYVNQIIRLHFLDFCVKKHVSVIVASSVSFQRLPRMFYNHQLILLLQVFICGPYPHWLFMTSRGILRIHPMAIDGVITCMTPFHNVNCPKGFLYFNRQVPTVHLALICTDRYQQYTWL